MSKVFSAPAASRPRGLVDEVILHQVPILLGGGRPFFEALPEHVRLRLVEAVPAPGGHPPPLRGRAMDLAAGGPAMTGAHTARALLGLGEEVLVTRHRNRNAVADPR
ncbi:hypothetical protein ABT294_34565 [Nonomuraea sp. NPDC000554]|uniref:hypothetical protein n=1 Tax=Nonomuraea sp. NPDC000554 TaxID=3154259 RepID=UPI00331F653D